MEMAITKLSLSPSYTYKTQLKHSLKFAGSSKLKEERRSKLTLLKELNWDKYERIRVVGKGKLD
jgi:hypothetical protein